MQLSVPAAGRRHPRPRAVGERPTPAAGRCRPRAPGLGVCDTGFAGAGAPRPVCFVRGPAPAPRHPPRQGPRPWTPKPAAASAEMPSLHASRRGRGVAFPTARQLPEGPHPPPPSPLQGRGGAAPAVGVRACILGECLGPGAGVWLVVPPPLSAPRGMRCRALWPGRPSDLGVSRGGEAPSAGVPRGQAPPWAGVRGGSARYGGGEAPHTGAGGRP